MKKTIITTVGTSFFENYSSSEVQDCFRGSHKGISKRIKTIRDESQSSNDYDDFDIEIEEIEEILIPIFFKDIHKTKTDNSLKWQLKEGVLNTSASAEITSILAIAEQEQSDNLEIEVYLLATDTVLSVFAAELIKKWFKQNKPEITVLFERPNSLNAQEESNHVIHKLSVSSNEDYQQGFMNLISVVTKLIQAKKKAKEETILNITGGYKAIIPILTLVGQIEEVPLKYIYDESSKNNQVELVEVRNLPISFDWELGELYLDSLSTEGLKIIGEKPETLNLLRNLSLVQKNKFKLTPLGFLFKEKLLHSLTNKKTLLGYLAELKVFEYFTQQEVTIIRGKTYWWNYYSSFYEQPRFDRDATKERKIDLDIFIKEETEKWFEVKSCSKAGLKKGFKQIQVMLDFIEKTNYTGIETLGLILYKLENTDISRYKNQIRNIRNLFKNKNTTCVIYCINIPENEKGMFNAKHFFEHDIVLNLVQAF